jgi:hypothetical protein
MIEKRKWKRGTYLSLLRSGIGLLRKALTPWKPRHMCIVLYLRTAAGHPAEAQSRNLLLGHPRQHPERQQV